MLGELDIISIQKQVFVDGSRVRRNQTIGELDIDWGEQFSPRALFRRDATTDTHEQVRDSNTLKEVAEMQGWSNSQLKDNLDNRRRVLEYLVDENITNYREVGAVIHTFQRNPEYVMDQIEDDNLHTGLLLGEQR
jgi:flagellar protein FlaI